jgi:hypothetical protein
MKPSPTPITFALIAALSSLAATSSADPKIELAPEHTDKPAVALGSGTTPDTELVRGLQEQRFKRAEQTAFSTTIGGYGEVTLEGSKQGDSERDWTADMGRLVLFVAHPFNDRFRFYGELEVEHTLSCASCKGEVSFEQAFLDAKLFGDKLGLRAGVVLVPIGITNQWHEPPVFHGVERPHVETVIIPSTWREIGIGAFGQPVDGLRFEAYAMTALQPLGINADGFEEARQEGSLAAAKAVAVAARVEYEPLLGLVLGASGYASDAGGNAKAFDARKNAVSLSAPVVGFTLDARMRRWGVEWKMLLAEFHIPNASALMSAFDAEGKPVHDDADAPVPEVMRGGYVEVAYDVLKPFGVTHQLLPFARMEAYDTQAAVPEGFRADPSRKVREATFGLSYRPIQQIVVKTDYQLRSRRSGARENQIDFGLGFMY